MGCTLQTSPKAACYRGLSPRVDGIAVPASTCILFCVFFYQQACVRVRQFDFAVAF